MKKVYIVAAKRTAVGKRGGVLSKVRPDTLMAHTIRAVTATLSREAKNSIADVIVGCAMPEGAQGMNVARIAALMADLPDSIPAVTVNRFCSSGLQTIALGADRIRLGEADLVLAGGVESMSQVPMGGFAYRANRSWFDDEHVAISFGMGITAENVAKQWKVSREAQDQFALKSHQQAIKAIDDECFAEEIEAFQLDLKRPSKKGIAKMLTVVDTDEGPRRDTTAEKLASLNAVFAARGSVTAGNTSQMSDGAACLLLASEEAVKKHGLKPLAEFVGFAVAGCPPEVMGIGPKFAIPKLLNQVGVQLEEIDWIELNEAFAAQALAVIQDVGLDASKVNPYGGAIALGHPLGATGAIKATTVIHALQKHQLHYGMVTMCIGTGMGAAGLFKRV